ncbi:hypothetical protein LCGC14_1539640 [marine sediment metagenome]|uniref:Uncharacterized protein n=1 Tax=marine sediment metagenome TaxID=412755 RepID=A0A0F9JED8_9ZZZZ|nr:hypothetical protein [archaeon]
MSKKLIRDKLLGGKDEDKEGFENIKNGIIKIIKGILAAIKKNYEVNINITCKIAGVGIVASFEFLKSEIEEEEREETESSKKIVEFLKQRIEKAKDKIINLLLAKNLTVLTFSASTEKIPIISSITDVDLEVTIKLVE